MPYLIVLLGLLLIFVEFFLPGGIVGAVGAVVVLVGIAVYVIRADSLWGTLAFIFGTLIAVGILIKFALWRIKRGKAGKGIFLNKDQEGYVASHFSEEFIGKTGEAVSDLKPSGHILVEGKRVQASSRTGYIYKGTTVIVVGGEGAHLIVKKG